MGRSQIPDVIKYVGVEPEGHQEEQERNEHHSDGCLLHNRVFELDQLLDRRDKEEVHISRLR